MNARWTAVADEQALEEAAHARIVAAAAQAIRRRGTFLVVLAGGSTPLGVYTMLRDADADWPRWQVWFGDERCVPADDPQRNSRMAGAAWLDHVPIPRAQVHLIACEHDAAAAADAYAATLRGIGEFDLVLLGLGEDGHTASLFPDRFWGADADAPDVLAIADAPKPPPRRVSLSAARLSRARKVMFLVAGASKRDAVARWRTGADIPARAIRPAAGVDVLVESALLRD